MRYTLSENDLRATLDGIEDGIVLKSGAALTRQRVEAAVRAALGGKQTTASRPGVPHEI